MNCTTDDEPIEPNTQVSENETQPQNILNLSWNAITGFRKMKLVENCYVYTRILNVYMHIFELKRMHSETGDLSGEMIGNFVQWK